jgi:hypothetical protein
VLSVSEIFQSFNPNMKATRRRAERERSSDLDFLILFPFVLV